MENANQESQLADLYHAQAATATAALKEKHIDLPTADIPAFMVPKGYELKTLERLSKKFADVPARLEQTVIVRDPDSFVGYLTRHGTSSVAVFCTPERMNFSAVLDYHDATAPKWGHHRCTLALERTRELNTWLKNDGEKMSQTDFARFIEDNASEIISSEDTPSGSEMLKIALTLSRTEDANFKSGTNLDNGETKFVFEQNFNDRAGEMGDLTIPRKIKIGVPLFKSADPSEGYAIDARFRYRVQQGRLTMWYELIRPERVIDDAVNTMSDYIKDQIAANTTDHESFAFYDGESR